MAAWVSSRYFRVGPGAGVGIEGFWGGEKGGVRPRSPYQITTIERQQLPWQSLSVWHPLPAFPAKADQ